MTSDLTFKQEEQYGREENIINATVGRQQTTVSLKSEELVASIQNTVKWLKSSSHVWFYFSQTSVSQRAISVWEYLRVKERKRVKLDEASDNTADTAERREMHRVWRFTWPGAEQDETTDDDDDDDDNDDTSSVSTAGKKKVV